jgi:hypothetical protein
MIGRHCNQVNKKMGSHQICPDCSVVYWPSEETECPRCDEIPSPSQTDNKSGNQSDSNNYESFDYDRYGDDWQRIREKILERDSYKCQNCVITDEEHKNRDDLWPPWGGLHIHHITPFKDFDNTNKANQAENLVALCASCHASSE